MKKTLLSLSLLAAGFGIGYYLSATIHRSSLRPQDDTPRYDTILIRDTLRVPIPLPLPDSLRIASVVRRLPIAPSELMSSSVCGDSADALRLVVVDTVADSVCVEIPMVRKVYADSTFRAVVSGYEPKLDSLIIFPQIVAVKSRRVRRPWGLGINAGINLGPQGFSPGISIGVTYTFLSF